MMRRIFISYARQDGLETARQLADRLRSVGFDIFLDLQSMVGGTQWQPELVRQVKQADFLVVLITEQANDSDYVYREITEAEKHNKPIIPVQVGSAALPVHLRGTWQAIPFEDRDIDRLVVEIQRSVLALKPASSLTPSRSWVFAVVIFCLGLALGALVTAFFSAQGAGRAAGVGEAPVISDVEIRKETDSEGGLILWQDLSFKDVDGDAFVVDWELVSTTGAANLDTVSAITPSEAQKTGTTYTARWACGSGQYTTTITATIYDQAGNKSNTVEYSLPCD